MADINQTISIITLSINGLNTIMKNIFQIGFYKRQYPTICCLQEIQLKYRDRDLLKVKEWKKIYLVNTTQKNGRVAILI